MITLSESQIMAIAKKWHDSDQKLANEKNNKIVDKRKAYLNSKKFTDKAKKTVALLKTLPPDVRRHFIVMYPVTYKNVLRRIQDSAKFPKNINHSARNYYRANEDFSDKINRITLATIDANTLDELAKKLGIEL